MSFASKQVTLYFTESSSDKAYQVKIMETAPGASLYHVHALYGRRGHLVNKLKLTKHGPVSLAEAESIAAVKIADKVKKGYTSDISGTPFKGYHPFAWSSFTSKEPPSIIEATRLLESNQIPIELKHDSLEMLFEEAPKALFNIPSAMELSMVYISNSHHLAYKSMHDNSVLELTNPKVLAAFKKFPPETFVLMASQSILENSPTVIVLDFCTKANLFNSEGFLSRRAAEQPLIETDLSEYGVSIGMPYDEQNYEAVLASLIISSLGSSQAPSHLFAVELDKPFLSPIAQYAL